MSLRFKRGDFFLKFMIGILILSLILLCFLVLEIAFRTFSPQVLYGEYQHADAPVFMESNITSWTLKPHTEGYQISPYGEFIVPVTINSYGLRGPELLPKTDYVKRVLILGDSFTYGYGVSEPASYVRKLEAHLNKDRLFEEPNSSFIYEVLNAGYAAGFSPDAYYAYLFSHVEDIQPDLVVMSIYLDNDLSDLGATEWLKNDSRGLPLQISVPSQFIDEKNIRRKVRTGSDKNPLIYHARIFLWSHSHLYSFWKKSFKNIISSYSGGYYALKKALGSPVEKDLLYSQRWEASTQEHWDRVQQIIKSMNLKLSEQGIPLVLVLINSRQQTVEKLWLDYEQRNIRFGKKLNKLRPNQEFMGLCEEISLPCLDLHKPFLSKDLQQWYFPIDGHWNEQGHELAAGEIYRFLMEENLV